MRGLGKERQEDVCDLGGHGVGTDDKLLVWLYDELLVEFEEDTEHEMCKGPNGVRLSCIKVGWG